jgi:hypothetical protein
MRLFHPCFFASGMLSAPVRLTVATDGGRCGLTQAVELPEGIALCGMAAAGTAVAAALKKGPVRYGLCGLRPFFSDVATPLILYACRKDARPVRWVCAFGLVRVGVSYLMG